MPNIMDDFPSKYLKGDDVEDHPTVTIRDVIREPVGPDQEMKPILYIEEYSQGVVLNKTNAGNIARLYGTETDNWSGKKVILGTEMVTFNGSTNPSIRIWPPKRQMGQQQPQAATRMRTDDAQLNRKVVSERNPPPVTEEEEIPF